MVDFSGNIADFYLFLAKDDKKRDKKTQTNKQQQI
jgi:hypothetical protein